MAEKEYIEREPAMQAIRNIRNTYSKAKNFVAVSVVDNILGEIADEVPAADVAPVVHGYNDNQEYYATDEFKCSVCGLHLEDWIRLDDEGNCYEYEFKYCPNCGAKMDEED